MKKNSHSEFNNFFEILENYKNGVNDNNKIDLFYLLKDFFYATNNKELHRQ